MGSNKILAIGKSLYETLKELIVEGSAPVFQPFMSEKVAGMPRMLREVRDGEVKMTKH